MYKLILILSLITVVSCSQSDNVGNENNSDINILESSLGNAFSIKNENSSLIYKYCPDNTCTEIVSTKSNNKNLDTFSLLYFYYASGYVYLKMDSNGGNFIDKSGEHVKQIIAQEKQCTGDEHQVASCMMSRLLASGIKGYSIRYDENHESKTIMNFSKLINSDNLKKIVSWRKSLPKNN